MSAAVTATLPCITVRQPWALCIATGHKNVENRGRPTSCRGLVGIHAAKAHDPAGDTDPRVVWLWGDDARVGAPVGAVIAVAELVDCHEAEQPANPILVADGSTCCSPWGDRDYNGKPGWHLVLQNVRRLDVPVYARGSLAMPWQLPEAETAKVLAQLGQVPA